MINEKDSIPDIEWIQGKRLGALSNPQSATAENLPLGEISNKLAKSLIAQAQASNLEIAFSPVIAFADLTFCPRMHELLADNDFTAEVVLLMDMPAIFADSVIGSLHTSMMTLFKRDMHEHETLTYKVFIFYISDDIVTYASK